MNEEEILKERSNYLNENLVNKKELADDRNEQPYLDFVIIKNNGKNLVKDPCDSLHLEKNPLVIEMSNLIRHNLLHQEIR